MSLSSAEYSAPNGESQFVPETPLESQLDNGSRQGDYDGHDADDDNVIPDSQAAASQKASHQQWQPTNGSSGGGSWRPMQSKSAASSHSSTQNTASSVDVIPGTPPPQRDSAPNKEGGRTTSDTIDISESQENGADAEPQGAEDDDRPEEHSISREDIPQSVSLIEDLPENTSKASDKYFEERQAEEKARKAAAAAEVQKLKNVSTSADKDIADIEELVKKDQQETAAQAIVDEPLTEIREEETILGTADAKESDKSTGIVVEPHEKEETEAAPAEKSRKGKSSSAGVTKKSTEKKQKSGDEVPSAEIEGAAKEAVDAANILEVQGAAGSEETASDKRRKSDRSAATKTKLKEKESSDAASEQDSDKPDEVEATPPRSLRGKARPAEATPLATPRRALRGSAAPAATPAEKIIDLADDEDEKQTDAEVTGEEQKTIAEEEHKAEPKSSARRPSRGAKKAEEKQPEQTAEESGEQESTTRSMRKRQVAGGAETAAKEPSGVEKEPEQKRSRRAEKTSESEKDEKHEEEEGASPKRATRGSRQPASKAEATDVVVSEKRVLRNRDSSTSTTETPTTPAQTQPRRTAAPQQSKTPTTSKTPSTTDVSSDKKGTSSASSRSKKKKAPAPEPADPYDFDNADDERPVAPLRPNLQMAKSSFGDYKITKSPAASGSKFAYTAKAAAMRSQGISGGSADTVLLNDDGPEDNCQELGSSAESSLPESFQRPVYRIVDEHVTFLDKLSPRGQHLIKRVEVNRSVDTKEVSALTPELRKKISPVKSSLSSGAMADSSSSESPMRIPQAVRYLDKPENVIAKEAAKTPSGRGGKKTPAKINLELFSDDMDLGRADDDDDFSPAPPKSAGGGKRKAPTSARKSGGKQRRGYEASTSDETDSFEATPTIKKPRTTEHGSAAKSRAKQVVSPTEAEKPKEEFNLPETPEDQLKADVDGQPGQLLPGARVLARWPDKNFYGGHVLHRDGFGRYRVRYLDGIVRDMPAPDVIPIIDLKEGNKLMVRVVFEDGEGELEPVTIVKCPSTSNSQEWFDATYVVANTVTEKQESVSWEKFVIDKEQVKNYVKTLTNKSAQEVDTSNIELSEGRPKRNRVQVTPFSSPTSPPMSRRKPATFFEQREEPDLTISSPTSATSAKHPASSRKSGASAAATEKAAAAKRGSRKPKEPELEAEEGIEDEEQMALPVALFEGQKFVLTSANRRIRQNEEAESQSEERPPIPFYKKQVRQMIEEAGGTVVEDFTTHSDTENCFLVADTHYRTHKYLSALARAVPCVSHMWIYNQRQEGRKLSPKNYLLPAGVSLEKSTSVEWHDNCPSLLKGLTVFVFTTNKPANPSALDFVQIWSPLVTCMGANVITELPTDGTKVDILLTDNSCSPDVLKAVEELGGYAVSSEWLIQAIITGELPKPDAHQKYKYDFVEQAPAAE